MNVDRDKLREIVNEVVQERLKGIENIIIQRLQRPQAEDTPDVVAVPYMVNGVTHYVILYKEAKIVYNSVYDMEEDDMTIGDKIVGIIDKDGTFRKAIYHNDAIVEYEGTQGVRDTQIDGEMIPIPC